MSNTAIEVKNLGKKYIIGHQKAEKYTTLRDVMVRGAKSIGNQLFRNSEQFDSTREEFWALKEVDFEIKKGDRVGIIGRNGAGKSTLLKILSRITEPTTGRIAIEGRVASLLEVGTGFHPELTGRENIFLNGAILGMSKVEIKRKFDEIVAFAEVEKFLDTPVKRYSSGMYVRLAFAVAAHLEPEILVVDEVLAVGDIAFQKKCLGKMEDVGKEGRTVLFVSHNMGAINSLCDRGIYLNLGTVEYCGTVQAATNRYLHSFHDSTVQTPGVIFQRESSKIKSNHFQILKVSLLDERKNLKSIVKTGDYLRIRIDYASPQIVPQGSVVLELYTASGNKLIEYSTRPLSGMELVLEKGESYSSCIIPCLPLAAGSYRLSVGLAVPMTQWLCKEENLAILEVAGHDLYQSNFPPTQERTPIAVPHYWELAKP